MKIAPLRKSAAMNAKKTEVLAVGKAINRAANRTAGTAVWFANITEVYIKARRENEQYGIELDYGQELVFKPTRV